MQSFDLKRDLETIGSGPDVLIMVHGFGVRRDSRGMFTDVANYLKPDYTSVLFDLNQVEGAVVTLRTLSEQASILKQVIAWAREQYPKAGIHIVAHSMGGMVTALAGETDLGQVILLAPPTRSGGDSTRRYFMAYEGAKLEDRTLTVPRKDGTTTVISLDYFDDMERYNPAQLIMDYAATKPLSVVEALEEDVIRHADYSVFEAKPGVDLQAIHGDHNFTGDDRDGLLELVDELLSGSAQ